MLATVHIVATGAQRGLIITVIARNSPAPALTASFGVTCILAWIKEIADAFHLD